VGLCQRVIFKLARIGPEVGAASRIQHPGAIPSARLRSVAAGPGVGALTQRLIPTGERSGLQTRSATTESVSLCTWMKKLTTFVELKFAIRVGRDRLDD